MENKAINSQNKDNINPVKGDNGTNKARVIQFKQRITIPNQIAIKVRSHLSIKGERSQKLKINKPTQRQTIRRINQIIKNEIIEVTLIMNNNNLYSLSISVIIPVYHGGNAFSQCLESLKNSSVSPLEVIVVVDGIDPESYKIATNFTDKVLQAEINKGPATARNKGAEIAKADILFFYGC